VRIVRYTCTLYGQAMWPWSYGSWIYNYIYNQCLSPLELWVRISIGARCTTCDKVCQWNATGRWFSPDPPVSSTNKTDLHDITEILLKVALNQTNKTNNIFSTLISMIGDWLWICIYLIQLTLCPCRRDCIRRLVGEIVSGESENVWHISIP